MQTMSDQPRAVIRPAPPVPWSGWWRVGMGVAGVAVVASVVTAVVAGGWAMIDLGVYRWGGEMARLPGSLYQAEYDGHLLFTYTPMAAVAFMPLSMLPFGVVQVLMVTASIGALAVTVGACLRSLGYRPGREVAGLGLAISAVAILLEPVRETLAFGQVNLILLALVVVDLCLPDTSRWKGVGVGVATGIKLTPMIFIAYLVITRRWAAAGRAAGVAAASVVAAFAVLPAASGEYWFGRLFLDPSRVGGIAYVANQSWQGALVRLTGSLDAARPWWWLAVLATVAVGLAVAWWWSRRGAELAAIVAVALTGLLVSPVSWSHHWVWVVPVLVLAVDAALRGPPWRWALPAVVVAVFSAVAPPRGLIWLVPNEDDRELAWNLGQAILGNLYLVAGLGVLGWLAWCGWERAARTTPGRTGRVSPW